MVHRNDTKLTGENRVLCHQVKYRALADERPE
jgi:hypothetical protein